MITHHEAMTGPTTYRDECGTLRGWWAHRWALEKACQPCRRAVAVGLREENVFTLGQVLEELEAHATGYRFWNPNLPEPKGDDQR